MARRLLMATRLATWGNQGNMKKNLLSQVSLIAVLSLTLASFANAAENPAQDLLTQVNAMNRLQKSDEAILASQTVRELKQSDAAHQFVITQHVNTQGVETTKYQHFYKGLEVIGSVAFHHLSANREEVQESLAKFNLDTTPQVNADQAAQIAQSMTGNLALREAPKLKILPNKKDGSARLIYSVRLKGNALSAGHQVTLDANSGKVLSDISDEISIGAVEVYQGNQNNIDMNAEKSTRVPRGAAQACQVIDSNSGIPLVIHVENCNQAVKDSAVSDSADDSTKRAFSNSQNTLTYFLNVHGRHGYDDQDSPTVSIVHAGEAFDNAFWNIEDNIMAYGDGDGTTYGDFTQGVDVAGHELTHGVTAHTAQLDYKGESGAINEANSDFFGKMIANDGTWTIGKQLNLDPNAPALRDLANPGSILTHFKDSSGNLKPYPAQLSEKIRSGRRLSLR